MRAQSPVDTRVVTHGAKNARQACAAKQCQHVCAPSHNHLS